MTLSDSTHTTIRVIVACITFAVSIYALCALDSHPKETIIRVQIAPPTK